VIDRISKGAAVEDNEDFEPLDTSRFPTTVRVTFEFDARRVGVRSKEHVEMIAPPSPAPIPARGAGTWVELRGAEEETLFRRALHDPFQTFAEPPTRDGGIEAFQRPVKGRGEFEVLLPLMDEATHGRLIWGEDAGLPRPQTPLTFDLEEKRGPRIALRAVRLVADSIRARATGGSAAGDVTVVVNNGDPKKRWNLVVLGDGYKQDELANFQTDVTTFAAALQATPPFDAMWPAINIYRVDVASSASGADDPKEPTFECDGTGANPTTYFNAKFCSPWGNQRLNRLLTVDSAKATYIANNRLKQKHQALVIANSVKYGGSGDPQVAVCSKDPEAFRVAIHELGHSAFSLADEYDDPNLAAPTSEPVQPNITISESRNNGKWGDLIQQSTPIPSSRNPPCGSFAGPPAPAGAVGAFEGAGHSVCGVFRPAATCLMRDLNDPFCPVCKRMIERTLKPFL
jgi:hypothetical protein